MQINEISQITPAQYLQFVPKQKYNIAKSTIQKVKSTITSLNSGIVTESGFKQTSSSPYSWIIGANNQSIIDLEQSYFNCAFDLEFDGTQEPILPKDLLLGNLFMGSLFQNATLELGGACIANNANIGIDANILACLKYDYNDLRNYSLSDRQFMVHDFDLDIEPSSIDIKLKQNKVVADESKANGYTGLLKLKLEADNGNKLPTGVNIICWNNATPKAIVDNFTATWLRLEIKPDGSGVGYAYGTAGGAITKGTTKNATGDVDLAKADVVVYDSDDVLQDDDRNSVFTPIKTVPDNAKYIIPIRCKLYLSDLFAYCVSSLDYVFNREVKITLTRSAGSSIICNVLNTIGDRQTKAEVVGCKKFELVVYSYLLTDSARNQMIQWYSQPIETLMGVETVNLTPFYNSNANGEQTITLPMSTSYDQKAIIIAIPKASNCLVPLSSNRLGFLPDKIPDNTTGLDNFAYQASWYGSNSNSYNYAGIKYIRISNTNNACIYSYDFAGTATQPSDVTSFIKAFDDHNSDAGVKCNILDYREAYEQMKNLRLLFGKSPDNAMDYYTWMKDYCFITIDLSGTNISPNTRILVTIQFDGWKGNYNPLYYGNVQVGNNPISTNILAVYFGNQVLAYYPDGTCAVKNVLSAIPNDKAVNLVK